MKRTSIAAIALVLAFSGSHINAGRQEVINDVFVAQGNQILTDMDELHAKAVKEHEEANAKFKRVTTAISEARSAAKGYIGNVKASLSNAAGDDAYIVQNKRYIANANGYEHAKLAADAAHAASN
jgi:hypothetical protein